MAEPKVIFDNVTKNRYYLVDNNKLYPSITTVLRKDLSSWRKKVGEEEADRISKHSTDKGTEIHKLIYEYLINNNSELKEKYPVLFEQLEPRLSVMVPKHMEITLWSDVLKVAGTADFIGDFNGVPYIIDFKTFKTDGGEYDYEILENYYLQATAYLIMAHERLNMTIRNIKILKICPWKYSEAVFDFDIKPTKELVNKLFVKIREFYKNTVIFPQISKQ